MRKLIKAKGRLFYGQASYVTIAVNKDGLQI